MTQIVAQQLQFYRIPQSLPRPAHYSVYKCMPKLTKQRLYPLSHAAVQFSLFLYIAPPDQQHFLFLTQHLKQLWPTVSQISKHHSTIYNFTQFWRCNSVIYVTRTQYRINDAAIDVSQNVQFEPEKPSCTAFAKISSFISQQPHSSVTDGFADWNRLGIYKVKTASASKPGRLKDATNYGSQSMKASNPLLIGAKFGKGRSKVIGNNLISFLERCNTEMRLHQSYGDDFCIGKIGMMIRGASPVSERGMSLKEVINKAEDMSHMIYNGSQVGRPPSVRLSLQLNSIHFWNYGDPAFQLNTQV